MFALTKATPCHPNINVEYQLHLHVAIKFEEIYHFFIQIRYTSSMHVKEREIKSGRFTWVPSPKPNSLGANSPRGSILHITCELT